MKRFVLLFAVGAVSVILLAGCGSRYVLVTNDYTVHIATSKPELDPSADTLTFRDQDGKDVTIPRADLKVSKELRD